MRIVLQRVKSAKVHIAERSVAEIGRGYLLLLAVMEGDGEEVADRLARKVCALRLFEGEGGKINDASLIDIGGGALVVSQFTLAGDVSRGNRPDYTRACAPAEAERLYRLFVQKLSSSGVTEVRTGEFGAHMEVTLINDGPVTLILEQA